MLRSGALDGKERISNLQRGQSMATVASHREHAGAPTVDSWTPQMGLRYAWFAYLALLVIPLLLFLYTVWNAEGGADGVHNRDLATRWFIGCVAYVVLV